MRLGLDGDAARVAGLAEASSARPVQPAVRLATKQQARRGTRPAEE
jgi:hypothetical protein